MRSRGSSSEGGAGVRGRQPKHVQEGHDLFYMLEHHSGCWRKNGLGWMGAKMEAERPIRMSFCKPS